MAPKCYFSEHFVANPATHSTKKREGHSAEMQKNTMLKKQRRTLCVFHMLAKLSMASFEALLSPEKKPSKIQRHPGVRSFFCVMSHKNDVRQNCVISFAFSYHIGGTCPVQDFSWSRNVAFFGTKKFCTSLLDDGNVVLVHPLPLGTFDLGGIWRPFPLLDSRRLHHRPTGLPSCRPRLVESRSWACTRVHAH